MQCKISTPGIHSTDLSVENAAVAHEEHEDKIATSIRKMSELNNDRLTSVIKKGNLVCRKPCKAE